MSNLTLKPSNNGTGTIELTTSETNETVVLTLPNKAGKIALVSDIENSNPKIDQATTAKAGIIQIATSQEVTAGTITNKAVVPKDLKTELDKKLNKTDKAASALVADSATKATQDKNGKDISTTYATKQELNVGLGDKLGRHEKAESAALADKAIQDETGKNISQTYATSINPTLSGYIRAGTTMITSPGDHYELRKDNGLDPNQNQTPGVFYAWENIPNGWHHGVLSVNGAFADGKGNVQINAGPSPNAYITQTWRAGSNWYRRYSDGFLMQGGYIDQGGYGAATISYHAAFTATDAKVLLSPGDNGSWDFGYIIQRRATSNCVAYARFGRRFHWFACGY